MAENFEGATEALQKFEKAKELLDEGREYLRASECDWLRDVGEVSFLLDTFPLILAIEALRVVQDGKCPESASESLVLPALIGVNTAEHILKRMFGCGEREE